MGNAISKDQWTFLDGVRESVRNQILWNVLP